MLTITEKDYNKIIDAINYFLNNEVIKQSENPIFLRDIAINNMILFKNILENSNSLISEEENTQENAEKYHTIYRDEMSIDLYNIVMNNPNIERWKRRMILGILKDRKEDDLIYSISINI